MASIDEQFIEYIVKSLVGNPDDVEIKRTIDEKGVLLELTVAQEDLGRVIGKRGATAQSIRTLLRALGTKNDARYNLKIIDPEGPAPRPRDDQPKNDSAQQDDSAAPVQDEPVDEPESPAESAPATEEPVEESESMAEKTRKELEEFDDLDI